MSIFNTPLLARIFIINLYIVLSVTCMHLIMKTILFFPPCSHEYIYTSLSYLSYAHENMNKQYMILRIHIIYSKIFSIFTCEHENCYKNIHIKNRTGVLLTNSFIIHMHGIRIVFLSSILYADTMQ